MNVRLSKTWLWQSGIVYDGSYSINHYTATTSLHTTSVHQSDHETAYNRMEYWFRDVMQDCVLIDAGSDCLEAYMATGQRVLALPDQPVDQIVGIMLLIKLNKICEGRLVITDVDISSTHGSDMTYLHNQSESCGPLAASGWWQDVRPIWNTTTTAPRTAKVVSLSRAAEWHNVGLDWSDPSSDRSSSVLFADFNRDEDQ